MVELNDYLIEDSIFLMDCQKALVDGMHEVAFDSKLDGLSVYWMVDW